VKVEKKAFDNEINEIRVMLSGTEQAVQVFVNEDPFDDGVKLTKDTYREWELILQKANSLHDF
jgi:hypothetical protein